MGQAQPPNNRLRQYREMSRWTLEDVAEKLSALSTEPIPLDRNAVSRHELGKIKKPSRRYRDLYSELYSVSEDQLWPPGDTGSILVSPPTSFTTDASAWLESRTSWEPGRVNAESN